MPSSRPLTKTISESSSGSSLPATFTVDDTAPPAPRLPQQVPMCTMPVTTCSSSYAAACHYPRGAPHRALFLAARGLAVLLGLAEIVLAVVAHRGLGREWMSPILSPAITVLWPAGLDIYFSLRFQRRSHPLSRLLYDGALGVGFAIAGGFLVSFTLNDITRRDPNSTEATAAVGTLILFTMFSSMLIQFAVSIAGGLDWLEFRRSRKAAVGDA